MAVCFAIMAVNNVARADVFSVHVASRHLTVSGIDRGFNEVNPGVGYALNTKIDHTRITTGYYHNSVRKDSAYLGAELYQRFNNPVLTEVGVDLVVVTGYEFPVGVAAYVRIADYLRVSGIPIVITEPNGDTNYDGIALGFSLAIGE